jgi:hypothetical protein
VWLLRLLVDVSYRARVTGEAPALLKHNQYTGSEPGVLVKRTYLVQENLYFTIRPNSVLLTIMAGSLSGKPK